MHSFSGNSNIAGWLLLFWMFLLAGGCSVQDETLETDSRRAEKKFNSGLDALKDRKRKEAKRELKKAIKIDSSFLEAYNVLGDLYRNEGNKEKARFYYKKAVEIDPIAFPENLFFLGGMALNEGKYDKAEGYFKKYLERPGGNEKMNQSAEKAMETIDFAKKAIKNPVDFDPKNMGKAINSPRDEYFPCITADNSMFLFTRRIKDNKNPKGMQEDFFYSVKSRGEWQKARNMGAPINSHHNEGAPTLSPDGQILIFTACAGIRGYGPRRRGKGSCDLFAAKKVAGKWSAPQNLGEPINDVHWQTQPSFSSDGRTLYFVQGKRTGKGIKEQDIYKSILQENGNWSKPEKLSSKINTPGREESVFIHPDGRTLYFSSNGHKGMGGLDIYMTKKQPDGSWSEPKNLGYPINTHNDENSLLVSPNGKRAYFGSDRKEGYGGLDLYYFELPKEFRPEPVTYMKGKVFDAETEKPLEASFELKDLQTSETVVNSWSDPQTGEFLLVLPTNRDYALSVDKGGYLFYSESFALKGKGTKTDPVRKDVPLQPIKKGKSVVLENVFFETAKYDLKPESKVELDKLYRFLKDNPKIRIELQGHTDSVGTHEDNKTLSENRAKAVFDYLVDKGIDPERMTHKGYGETKPIADNSTPKGRAKNRRTAFKVIEK